MDRDRVPSASNALPKWAAVFALILFSGLLVYIWIEAGSEAGAAPVGVDRIEIQSVAIDGEGFDQTLIEVTFSDDLFLDMSRMLLINAAGEALVQSEPLETLSGRGNHLVIVTQPLPADSRYEVQWQVIGLRSSQLSSGTIDLITDQDGQLTVGRGEGPFQESDPFWGFITGLVSLFVLIGISLFFWWIQPHEAEF